MTNPKNLIKPLSGKRIIELAGLGPAPYCGQLLADMGAEVILIDRPKARRLPIENRGKKSIIVDLRNPGAAEVILQLIESADALIEGLRPGVTERLGIGPEACHARNPKLVYGRMTGWGQDGPWAPMAGHDINYLSITGALYAMGNEGKPPTPPLNVVGDYGGGSLFLALGVVAGLMQAQQSGKGEIVDAAITDGVSSMLHMVHSLSSMGLWSPQRESNKLDGAAPFYQCYKTADDQFMAVGCIEPQFFAMMVEKLELDLGLYGDQNDVAAWPKQIELLAQIFSKKSRDHWAELFDGSDACVTPVLNFQEAQEHKHLAARDSHITQNVSADSHVIHPNQAPRFLSNTTPPNLAFPKGGEHTLSILQTAGFDTKQIESLLSDKVVFDSLEN
jgi:alpha-methylacyl-CoA racemase